MKFMADLDERQIATIPVNEERKNFRGRISENRGNNHVVIFFAEETQFQIPNIGWVMNLTKRSSKSQFISRPIAILEKMNQSVIGKKKFLSDIASLIEYKLPLADIFSRNKVEALIFSLERTIFFTNSTARVTFLSSIDSKENCLTSKTCFLFSNSSLFPLQTNLPIELSETKSWIPIFLWQNSNKFVIVLIPQSRIMSKTSNCNTQENFYNNFCLCRPQRRHFLQFQGLF